MLVQLDTNTVVQSDLIIAIVDAGSNTCTVTVATPSGTDDYSVPNASPSLLRASILNQIGGVE